MNHNSQSLKSPSQPTVTSPCGGIAITTTGEGIPVQLQLSRAQMCTDRAVLASRIVALCALARAGSGYRQRLSMASDGTPPEVLDALELPDRDRLLTVEEAADDLCRGGVR